MRPGIHYYGRTYLEGKKIGWKDRSQGPLVLDPLPNNSGKLTFCSASRDWADELRQLL